jgi:hypothetical protein
VSAGRHPESLQVSADEAGTLPRLPYAWRMRALVHLGVLCRRVSSYSYLPDGIYRVAVEEKGGSPVQRLVVIEDEPEIAKVVFRALSSARFQIDCAAGRGGLEMARNGHHDLVLLDLMGSGQDGVGGAGLTVKAGGGTPRGTFTPTVRATSGSIAYQATTKLREGARS